MSSVGEFGECVLGPHENAIRLSGCVSLFTTVHLPLQEPETAVDDKEQYETEKSDSPAAPTKN